MSVPIFNPQTNLWSNGQETLIPFGGNDPASPDMLYGLKTLMFYGVDGAGISPYTYHAATDRFTSSDQPSADQLLNPKTLPTSATVASVNLWATTVSGFATELRPAPIDGAKPIVGSGSEGTEDPLGPTAIVFTDGNGDKGEYDAGALAWGLSVNTAMYMANALKTSLRDQGLR